MNKELSLPEEFIHCKLAIVAVRTQMILELKMLSDDQRRLAIDDMINKQMEDIKIYSAIG